MMIACEWSLRNNTTDLISTKNQATEEAVIDALHA